MGTSVYTDHLHHLSPTHAYDGGEYSSDEFRMYEFKIRRCTRSRSHDWTDCPFAHPGEKARRRDPLYHPYFASVCPDFRRSGGLSCPRGDACGLAHGVFESRLHPSRYRTEACKDGPHCPRKVCFFAHSAAQLRRSPPVSYQAAFIRSLVSSLRVDVVQDPFISSPLTLTPLSNDSFDANGFSDPDPDLGWVDELLR